MILVIDDDPAIREFISIVLNGLGFEVMQAADAETGLRLFHLTHPQLIITDIILPDKDGFHYIHDIRKVNQDIPIIAMTSNVHGRAKDYLAQSKRMGANEVMQKPLTIELVKQTVLELYPPKQGRTLEEVR